MIALENNSIENRQSAPCIMQFRSFDWLRGVEISVITTYLVNETFMDKCYSAFAGSLTERAQHKLVQ